MDVSSQGADYNIVVGPEFSNEETQKAQTGPLASAVHFAPFVPFCGWQYDERLYGQGSENP